MLKIIAQSFELELPKDKIEEMISQILPDLNEFSGLEFARLYDLDIVEEVEDELELEFALKLNRLGEIYLVIITNGYVNLSYDERLEFKELECTEDAEFIPVQLITNKIYLEGV